MNPDELFVAHDPVSGDAAFTYRCVPHINDEGDIVLMPLAAAPPVGAETAGASRPVEEDSLPDLADASDDESECDFVGEGTTCSRAENKSWRCGANVYKNSTGIASTEERYIKRLSRESFSLFFHLCTVQSESVV